jgi:pimeloyl-ACP methyl ester carboxylesterase
MTTAATSAGGVRSADGTTIAFERTGAGPALILVDAAGHYRDFSSFGTLTGLLAPDFSVFTYDRRGRGRSTDTLPYAIEREVDDLAALFAEAGGLAFLYGVSSGALLALQAAASGLAIPKLALFEPPIGSDEDASADTDFTRELADLVAAGRRGDAVERFHLGIGVPRQVGDGTHPRHRQRGKHGRPDRLGGGDHRGAAQRHASQPDGGVARCPGRRPRAGVDRVLPVLKRAEEAELRSRPCG